MTMMSVPDHVRESHVPHGGSVLLDVRSGRCFAMNSAARTLWQEWRRGQDFDSGVRVMADRYPAPCHEALRDDARRLFDELTSRGLLAVGSLESVAAGVPGPDTASVGAEVPMAADRAWPGSAPSDGAWSDRARTVRGMCGTLLGGLGLLVALLLIRVPFRTLVRVVGWTESRWCRAEATPSQAAASLEAVRRAAVLYPGRAACLELSLATLVVLAFTRRRVVWCLGAAVDPYRFHAWTEAEGVPVGAPDEYGGAAFRRILSV
ncbi:lasso peptide biosynthesis B2 protein [Streptomyces sp. NPDC006997]|uniref:lasso peptide biosynthesis B2 protein n=1 Tax=Streptomyces sp. NPDC006997 TaxID=3155356 RepID=UPI0033E888C2